MRLSTGQGIILVIVAVLAAGIGLSIRYPDPTLPQTCEVTWYKATDHTVAMNPRHRIPDGAYIQFTNRAVVPNTTVIVRKRGHMNPKAAADFDLCPEAFKQLAPLSEGRLKQVEWKIVYP